MKATHDGTCQICGSQQRLPGGVMAQHGYRVQWNSFVGVCSGSGQPAFEASRDVLGEEIASLRGREERLASKVAALEGPAPTLYGIHRYAVSGQGDASAYGLFSHGTDAQGRPALLLTSKDRVFVIQVQRAPGAALPTPQQAADASRARLRNEAQQQLGVLSAYLRRQQARYDGWAPREALPLTDLDSLRSARAQRPKALTQKEQAQARHAERFQKKYGRAPLWPAHQTTLNNEALFGASDLLGHVTNSSVFMDEHTHRRFMKAAGEVMNVQGHEAFAAWLNQTLGLTDRPLSWNARERYWCQEGAARPFSLEDVTGSAQAALDIEKRGPAAYDLALTSAQAAVA